MATTTDAIEILRQRLGEIPDFEAQEGRGLYVLLQLPRPFVHHEGRVQVLSTTPT